MGIDRRKFLEAGALGGAAALTMSAAAAAQDNAPAQARTSMLGTSAQQFYLAKISVSNLTRSYQFYTEVIGLQPATPLLTPPTDADPEQDFREFPLNFTGSLADPIFVLVKQRGVTPTPEGARLTTIGFKVPDAHAVMERAAQAGYQSGRRDTGAGPMLFAMVDDPDGYKLELIQAPSYPTP